MSVNYVSFANFNVTVWHGLYLKIIQFKLSCGTYDPLISRLNHVLSKVLMKTTQCYSMQVWDSYKMIIVIQYQFFSLKQWKFSWCHNECKEGVCSNQGLPKNGLRRPNQGPGTKPQSMKRNNKVFERKNSFFPLSLSFYCALPRKSSLLVFAQSKW